MLSFPKKQVMVADVTIRPRKGKGPSNMYFSSILACVGAWLMNFKEPKSTMFTPNKQCLGTGRQMRENGMRMG